MAALRKVEGLSFLAFHSSVLSSVRPSVRPSFHPSVLPSFRAPIEVGTLWAQLLLQFYSDSFETLLVFQSWSENMHVILI